MAAPTVSTGACASSGLFCTSSSSSSSADAINDSNGFVSAVAAPSVAAPSVSSSGVGSSVFLRFAASSAGVD